MLHPQSGIEITLHGVCLIIENKSPDAQAYIPTDTKEVWENFESYVDKDGKPLITVRPCE